MAFDSGTVVVSRPESFTIKGVLLPMTLLELRTSDVNKITEELTLKVADAPSFFSGSPVVVGVESIAVDTQCLEAVVGVCARLGFRLAGIKGGGAEVEAVTRDLKLGHFPNGKVKNSRSNTAKSDSLGRGRSLGSVNDSAGKYVPSKIVSSPVRSGQQVYADGDLIVLAPVSAGAELLAAGCIHIYAPMRGRALAGVKGDESARIFCMSQEAELVSIAGHFMIDENLRDAHWRCATQIFFDGNELRVEPIKGYAT